jgi:hypothetical protein
MDIKKIDFKFMFLIAITSTIIALPIFSMVIDERPASRYIAELTLKFR